MFGANIGSLNVYRYSSVTSLASIAWSRSNSQDDHWRRAVANFKKAPNDDFTIHIEAVKGSIPRSIAIDDIEVLEDKLCEPSYFCDFEEDICGWVNVDADYMDDLDWLRNTGNLLYDTVGPSIDVIIFVC